LVAQRGQTQSERGRAERVGERGLVGAMAAFSAYRILVAETNGSNLARARQIFRCRLKSCRSFPLPIVGDSRRYAHSPVRSHATSLAAFKIWFPPFVPAFSASVRNR